MIRLRNLDLRTDGMKEFNTVALGDITATRTHQVFVAPVACVVNYVDIFSNEANPPAGTTASTTNMSATLVAIINGTATTMQTRGTSATAVTTNSISANARWRLIPSAGNSLTQGTPVRIAFTIAASGTLSGTIVSVTYTPLIHRETR